MSTDNYPKPSIHWRDEFSVQHAVMDQTHQEFVALLNTVLQAPDAQLLPAWEALVDHTQTHFDQEDRWMRATGFSADNCHSSQHAIILKILRDGTTRARCGHLDVPRQMAFELIPWFEQHAQAMDAALALHLQSVGYDTRTGTVAHPQALPQASIAGCGGTQCSDPIAGEDPEDNIPTSHSPL
ncbi:MAG: hemerythrin domain-containing protein [Rhodoferax sp.]